MFVPSVMDDDGKTGPMIAATGRRYEYLKIDITAPDPDPVLVPDLASGVAGTRVVVQPLTNDRNPEGRELTLKNVRVVGEDAGTEVSKDLESGTFTFVSSKAKSYYLEYTAYNSSATRSSFIRLDIESPPKDNRPPVAVRDKAVITPGGTAQVDLLLNDLDPDGDPLTARVQEPPIHGDLSLEPDGSFTYVPPAGHSGATDSFTYQVSDGASTSTGTGVPCRSRDGRTGPATSCSSGSSPGKYVARPTLAAMLTARPSRSIGSPGRTSPPADTFSLSMLVTVTFTSVARFFAAAHARTTRH